MLAPCVALLLVALSGGGRETIQPCNLSSPSGEWTARTDPSSKFGDGPSRISVWRDGQPAWEAEMPFTLWEAQISDEGQLAGYGFTAGHQDLGAKGELVVAGFSPDGRELLHQSFALTWSRFVHMAPNPRPLGSFLQFELDRFVLRVADEDVNRGDETWWVYQLSNGEALGKVQPKHALGSAEGVGGSMEARPIVGTPLTLVQWYQWDPREGGRPGTRFTLLGEDWKPVWTLELARDYAHADHAEADRLRDEAWTQGGILAADEPGRFELRHVAAQERVSYAVEANSASASGWTVRELMRVPYVATVTKSDEWLSLELRKIASVALQTGPLPTAGPVHDVVAFEFDSAGAVRVVQGEPSAGYALLTLAPDGSVSQQARIDELLPDADGTRAWHWIGDERWLFTLSPFGEDVVSRAWFIDALSGAATEVADFAGPSVDAVRALSGGGFVVLGGFFRPHTINTAVIAFDAAGRRRWQIVDDRGFDGEDASLLEAQDIAVEPDGSVLVLDNTRRFVQVFDIDGGFRRAVDLGGLGQHAYLTSLRIEPSGTWLVFQFSSNDGGQWHRFGPDGSKLASFIPREADGTPGAMRGELVRIDPAGGFWCTDGQALQHLDESGVLRPRFGSAPDADVLEEPLTIHFDDSGRLAVVDRRSHSIHVFRASGERERVLHPDPADFEESWFPLQAFVSAPDDRLFVPGKRFTDLEGDRYLEFAPDGRRVGWTDLGGDLFDFRADGGRWSAHGSFHSACSVASFGADGTPGVSIARRPNGDFYLGIDAIDEGPDGSLAVLTGADEDRLELDLYSSTGAVLRTVDLHAAGGRYWNRLSQSPDWIAVSSFMNEALLVPRNGGPPNRVRVEEGTRDDGCAFTLSPDGTELWCATREPLALHRYALPDSP